jgi:type II secretory pathway pseudopilin PulG
MVAPSLRSRSRHTAGYSLVELLLVVGLIAVVAGMTVFSVQAALPGMIGNAALDTVVGALRLGRDSAIDTGGETTITTAFLEGAPSFVLTPGLPDTPDAFANATAVDFGGAAVVRFRADGTLTDGAGLPVNGSIFIGVPGTPLAARAATLVGATGRAMPYRWNGAVWDRR